MPASAQSPAAPPATGNRARRGRAAQRRGLAAEAAACAALQAEGWTVLGRRLRTAAGEVDAVAEKDGLLVMLEVKSRPTLATAAAALSPRQRARLLAAAAILLAEHPEWGLGGVRFDVLLVDAAGAVRRIADAFRCEG
jgi:putative endonuclease